MPQATTKPYVGKPIFTHLTNKLCRNYLNNLLFLYLKNICKY